MISIAKLAPGTRHAPRALQAWLHTSSPLAADEPPLRGTPHPEDPAEDLKAEARKVKEAVTHSDAADVAHRMMDRAKEAASWAAEAVKGTYHEAVNTAANVAENLRDDTRKAMSDQAGAAGTGVDSRAELRESMVKAGLSGFVPEAGTAKHASEMTEPELSGLRDNVEAGRGPNTPEDLAKAEANPDLVRGDTLPPGKVADGATSKKSRVGGQPAGSLGTPPEL